MKNYSSNRAQKGKTAYRTPSPWKAGRAMQVSALRSRKSNEKIFDKRYQYTNGTNDTNAIQMRFGRGN